MVERDNQFLHVVTPLAHKPNENAIQTKQNKKTLSLLLVDSGQICAQPSFCLSTDVLTEQLFIPAALCHLPSY